MEETKLWVKGRREGEGVGMCLVVMVCLWDERYVEGEIGSRHIEIRVVRRLSEPERMPEQKGRV